jgi:MOSC domain-containing protein YiiM
MPKEVVGKVLEVFISTKEGRVKKESISLDENGVCEDKFYGKDINRSVLIVSKKSYDIAKSSNIDIELGKIGENILVDFDAYSLEAGERLQIGEAIVEISQSCTICNGLSKIDSKLPKLLKKDRGIFAKVIDSGNISKFDKITLI